MLYSEIKYWIATSLIILGTVSNSTAQASDSKKNESQLSHQHHSIDYIEFSVTSLDEAKKFYASALGWTFNDYGPAYAGIQKPGGGEMGGMLPAKRVVTGGPLVVLYSDNLEASLASVKKAGGTITKQIFEFPGGRRFQFKDPSGNELAVAAWSK